MMRDLSRRDFLVAVAAAASTTGVRAQTTVPSLKDACRGVFLIGTAFDFRTPTEFTPAEITDRKSTRLNSSHLVTSYAVFCLKKKKTRTKPCRNQAFIT